MSAFASVPSTALSPSLAPQPFLLPSCRAGTILTPWSGAVPQGLPSALPRIPGVPGHQGSALRPRVGASLVADPGPSWEELLGRR